MPYIKQEDRKQFEPILAELDKLIFYGDSLSAGELNFFISSILWRCFDTKRKYETANMIMGVLDSIKHEFYRRQVAPYEDEKMKENGDIDL